MLTVILTAMLTVMQSLQRMKKTVHTLIQAASRLIRILMLMLRMTARRIADK